MAKQFTEDSDMEEDNNNNNNKKSEAVFRYDIKSFDDINTMFDKDLISKWEYKFLLDIINLKRLTDRQQAIVDRIKIKVSKLESK